MKKRVLLALSGGVDSTVSAYLLKEKGYEVKCITFLLTDECGKGLRKSCCSIEDIILAKEVCKKLGVDHTVLNGVDLFNKTVKRIYLKGLKDGVTINPCVYCNELVKFKLLYDIANLEGFEFIATGHYARVFVEGGRVKLKRGIDKNKDQSYFLYSVPDYILERTLFPLGEMKKEEVKKIAIELDLFSYDKKESQDLCFQLRHDIDLLRKEGIEEKEGDIILGGEVVGKHKGLSNYTVGQRRGIGIPFKEPLYVLRMDRVKNCLYVGTREMALKKRFAVENFLFREKEGVEIIEVQVRYRMKPLKAKIYNEKGIIYIEWLNEREIASPGQVAVGYLGDLVIGGGVIKKED